MHSTQHAEKSIISGKMPSTFHFVLFSVCGRNFTFNYALSVYFSLYVLMYFLDNQEGCLTFRGGFWNYFSMGKSSSIESLDKRSTCY